MGGRGALTRSIDYFEKNSILNVIFLHYSVQFKCYLYLNYLVKNDNILTDRKRLTKKKKNNIQNVTYKRKSEQHESNQNWG